MRNLVKNQTAILITGPTASGKSAFAAELAAEHNGVVINADSMQVYDTLHVLTARPANADMAGVAHRLYGTVSATSLYSTGMWLADAQREVQAAHDAGKIPVFVGGTGLYFKALTGGLSDMPAIPDDIRSPLRARLLSEGAEALHPELVAVDPLTAAILRPGDGQRIVRALEVFAATGQSIRTFQNRTGPMLIDPDTAAKFVVLPERKLLHTRINRRFAQMLDGGAVEEVRALLALNLSPSMPVMKAIGVPQIAQFLEGRISREEVIETGAAATRQYAKRQMTWFRNQLDADWQRIDPADVG